jgi:hypothetical protein
MDTNDRENMAPTREQTTDGGPDDTLAANREGLASQEAAPGDPEALVVEMIEFGEWPAPDLMDQIRSAGHGAVEPLLDILRSRPRGWPEEAPLHHAIALLSAIRPAAAIPELVSLLRSYLEDTGEEAARALICFGRSAFEPLFQLCIDRSMSGYRRHNALNATVAIAFGDRALEARIAEVLRRDLESLIPKVREQLAGSDESDDFDESDAMPDDFDVGSDDLSPHDGVPDVVLDQVYTLPDEEVQVGDSEDEIDGDPNDDEYEEEEDLDDDEVGDPDGADAMDPDEDLSFIIRDLAELRDPLARELINLAFHEELTSPWIVDREMVDRAYNRTGLRNDEEVDWLTDYRHAYEHHFRPKSSPHRPRAYSPRIEVGDFDRDDDPDSESEVAVTAPIRNADKRMGRNEPCWCGSGKKYKKCHLGRDSLT